MIDALLETAPAGSLAPQKVLATFPSDPGTGIAVFE